MANSDIGALVGDNVGTISKCYSKGTISAMDEGAGGLVGATNESSTISECYSTAEVSGAVLIGGLVGYSVGGTIENSYATGDVSGLNGVGGFVGENDEGSGSTITNCYSTGAVSATGTGGDVGGLVGNNRSGSTITTSYWNTTTSGQTEGIGVDSGTATGVEGLTTAEMRMQGSYMGWDFTMIWNAPTATSFPTLRGVGGQ